MKPNKKRCHPIHRLSELAQELLSARLSNGDHVMDATMGNGYDTAFLWYQVKPLGCVTAFDLQSEAVEATRRWLTEQGWTKNETTVQLVHDTHRNFPQYIEKPLKAAMFNLGYLPGSDKKVITQWPDLLLALEALTDSYLLSGGMITIVSYPGHPGGEEEQRCLMEYVGKLPPKTWAVTEINRINSQNPAPRLLFIQKKDE